MSLPQFNQKLFNEGVKSTCEKLRSVAENGHEIVIITHLDADGITSGSILATALAKLDAKYTVRTVSEMNTSLIDRMGIEKHDFYIITDLGVGWASQLRKTFADNWIIIDHHQIPKEEILTDDSGQVFNAWKYGIDGGKEIAAGGMSYMVASGLDRKNRTLSSTAIVSAVADTQDQGDKRSFVGLNAEILKTAQSLGLVNVDLDLMLTGRETRPLHEALAYTSSPYIDGLTWNVENCYTILKDAGIKLKDSGSSGSSRWKVPSEFSQEEKSAILDAINKFVANSSKFLTGVLDDLIGYVYTLVKEDKHSQLRDAREFSSMMNACGRSGKAGVGISICMGDRSGMMIAGETISKQYHTMLRNYISTIFSERWRVVDDGKYAFVNGDGLLAGDMLGAVSSLLSGSPNLSGRLLFVRALSNDQTYRFSSRKCLGCSSQANLGLIMRHCAQVLSGNGGGHSAAGGCTIPSYALEDFVTSVKIAVSDPKFAAQP